MNTSDSPTPQRRFNTRLGLFLFLVYLTLYTGFVLINAFAADKMETIVLAGLNLAIVYGFGLIVFAIVLALVYGLMCRRDPAEDVATEEAAATAQGDSK